MADPWKDLTASFIDLHRQVDEMFEELVFRRWDISNPAAWQPAVDVYATDEEYFVTVDLPDVAPDQVQFLIGERDLLISGERHETSPEATNFARCERPSGRFQRKIDFGEQINPKSAKAECRYGTYRLRIPKKEGERTPPEPAATRYVVHVTLL